MRHLLLTLVLSATFTTFTACGNQGAGVSTDTQSSADTAHGSTLERTKTLSVERRTSATITVPVMPLIGEAWGELAARAGETTSYGLCSHLWEQALSGKTPDEHEHDAATTCAFAFGYIYAFTPTMGWSVSPKSAESAVYIASVLAHVLAANNVASEVAAHLTLHTYRDLETANATIKELLHAQRAYFLRVYPLIHEIAQVRGTIDLSGKAEGVAFSKGVYHVALGAAGAVVKYAGVDWFGNGNLSGKRYELQLASMTGVAMTRGQTITDAEEHKVGANTKASTGVGK
jgi:hypothetical protein